MKLLIFSLNQENLPHFGKDFVRLTNDSVLAVKLEDNVGCRILEVPSELQSVHQVFDLLHEYS